MHLSAHAAGCTRVFTLRSASACSAKILVKGEPNVSYICSRYYRAPELIFGATDYTCCIGALTFTYGRHRLRTREPCTLPKHSSRERLKVAHVPPAVSSAARRVRVSFARPLAALALFASLRCKHDQRSANARVVVLRGRRVVRRLRAGRATIRSAALPGRVWRGSARRDNQGKCVLLWAEVERDVRAGRGGCLCSWLRIA